VKLYKKKITFLLSGKGSNLLKILETNIKKKLFRCYSIITNNTLSLNIKKLIEIKKLDIKVYENISSISPRILEGTELIFSVGYMKTIDTKIINKYEIINLHPSLLPSYKGLMTQKRMLINQERYFGFSIHKVSPLLDNGEVISQKSKLIKDKSELRLINAHKKLEHKYVFNELFKYLN
jgi:phosphoribosylglycinamide formyltransferase-1